VHNAEACKQAFGGVELCLHRGRKNTMTEPCERAEE
jgi:hypothetical protein